jgi:hypothetical protein
MALDADRLILSDQEKGTEPVGPYERDVGKSQRLAKVAPPVGTELVGPTQKVAAALQRLVSLVGAIKEGCPVI